MTMSKLKANREAHPPNLDLNKNDRSRLRETLVPKRSNFDN